MSRLDDPEFTERWNRFADTLQEDHDLLRALLERVADLESRVARLEEAADVVEAARQLRSDRDFGLHQGSNLMEHNA